MQNIVVNYENKALQESRKTCYLFITINVQLVEGENFKNPINTELSVK